MILKTLKEFGILPLLLPYQMIKKVLQIGYIKLMMYVKLIKGLVLDMKIYDLKDKLFIFF